MITLIAICVVTVNAVISDVNLAVDPHMAPPSEQQAKCMRQIVLAGFGDHVARWVTITSTTTLHEMFTNLDGDGFNGDFFNYTTDFFYLCQCFDHHRLSSLETVLLCSPGGTCLIHSFMLYTSTRHLDR